jgi:hypothetical protein
MISWYPNLIFHTRYLPLSLGNPGYEHLSEGLGKVYRSQAREEGLGFLGDLIGMTQLWWMCRDPTDLPFGDGFCHKHAAAWGLFIWKRTCVLTFSWERSCFEVSPFSRHFSQWTQKSPPLMHLLFGYAFEWVGHQSHDVFSSLRMDIWQPFTPISSLTGLLTPVL